MFARESFSNLQQFQTFIPHFQCVHALSHQKGEVINESNTLVITLAKGMLPLLGQANSLLSLPACIFRNGAKFFTIHYSTLNHFPELDLQFLQQKLRCGGQME